MSIKETVIQFSGTVYENGYGLLPQKVMRDRNLSPTAKTIYAYLVSFANVNAEGERSSFPGVKLMMSEIGIKSRDTFYRHRNQLIKHGYISIKKQRSEGKFQRNIYVIESVPEIAKEKLKEEEKEPCPKNKDMVPCPKKSTTEKSTTENQDTNINSTNINRFKDEEENKAREKNQKNKEKYDLTFHVLEKVLKDKNVNNKTIKEIINLIENDFTKEEIDLISVKEIKEQHNHMMGRIAVGSPIYEFAKYFVIGLRNRIVNKQAYLKFAQNRQKIDADKDILKFNWLAE